MTVKKIKLLYWALIAGVAASAGLSYWIARRITKPMLKLERVTQQFDKLI